MANRRACFSLLCSLALYFPMGHLRSAEVDASGKATGDTVADIQARLERLEGRLDRIERLLGASNFPKTNNTSARDKPTHEGNHIASEVVAKPALDRARPKEYQRGAKVSVYTLADERGAAAVPSREPVIQMVDVGSKFDSKIYADNRRAQLLVGSPRVGVLWEGYLKCNKSGRYHINLVSRLTPRAADGGSLGEVRERSGFEIKVNGSNPFQGKSGHQGNVFESPIVYKINSDAISLREGLIPISLWSWQYQSEIAFELNVFPVSDGEPIPISPATLLIERSEE